MLLVFAGTLFTSATLLFLVQPMIGKMILPLLGGTPEVWNTCMVFFQAMLLAGYAYAHAMPRWLGVRKQAAFHLAVLIVPLLLFIVLPLNAATHKNLITGGSANPILQVLLLLLLTVGVPFFVVSTSAPLLQKWFADTDHPAAKDPYFLYGASNLGSMLALLGYPTLVEPWLGVPSQTHYWVIGYGILVLFIGGCAACLWLSPPPRVVGLAGVGDEEAVPAPEPAMASPPDPDPESPDSSIKTDDVRGKRGRRRRRDRNGEQVAVKTAAEKTGVQAAPAPAPAVATVTATSTTLAGEVTWGRRMRWVVLAAVPSSLMLGATTYATTDIAAIPLLWVLPLALYLTSFILVFAKIAPRTQSYTVWALLIVLLLGVAIGMRTITEDPTILAMIWAGALLGGYFSLKILSLRDPRLLHQAMVLILPLLVLVLVFMMLTDIKPKVTLNIALHMVTLFVVAMVCHGEMAHDRPAAKHLTEFFLWMSVGGVVGGLFNALFAPLAFHSLAEYPLAMVVACMLLPPLGRNEKNSRWSLVADISLVAVFVITGGLLIGLRLLDRDLDFGRLPQTHWAWPLTAFLGVLVVGAVYSGRAQGRKRLDRILDVALPLALLVLCVGLIWGIVADRIGNRIGNLALDMRLWPEQLRVMLVYGLPIVLCYTFVERSFRFGLGVGAILLASTFCELFNKANLYQTRSFFGVLKVEQNTEKYTENLIFFGKTRVSWDSNRLVHGTTLHGRQFTHPDLRSKPITYYDVTGPMGHMMTAYNEPGRHMGVIGLGTGTMAAWAQKDQHVTFYDIDPTVKDISFDTDKYFSFVQDAKKRGVTVDLVIDDARLALERTTLEGDDKFGILIVDAFSSDAIPIHLITWEAMEIYLRNLREDGLLIFHVSNRYLNLKPVLARHAEKAGLVAFYENDNDESEAGKARSTWVVLARKKEYLDKLNLADRLDPEKVWDALLRRARDQGPDEEKKLKEKYGNMRDALSEWITKNQLPKILTLGVVPLEHAGQMSRQELVDMRELAGELEEVLRGVWFPVETQDNVKLWTDDYSNLLSVFSWGG
jgi:SAM-dependent methyltransferase